MDELSQLVATQFRDIVEMANAAIENAGEDADMLKAAQALRREGEQDLNRIEQQCKKMLGEYGSNFLSNLRDNSKNYTNEYKTAHRLKRMIVDVARFRTELLNMLWEFDDHLCKDSFLQPKFAELQNMSRKAALKIVDRLKRIKLEVSEPNTPSPTGNSGQLSPPSPLLPGIMSPLSGTLSPGVHSMAARNSTASTRLDTARQEQITAIERCNSQLTSANDMHNFYSGVDMLRHRLAMKPLPPTPPPPLPAKRPQGWRVTWKTKETLDWTNLTLKPRSHVTICPHLATSPAQHGLPNFATGFQDNAPWSGRNASTSLNAVRWVGAFRQSPNANEQEFQIPRSKFSPLHTQLVGSWVHSNLNDQRLRYDCNLLPPTKTKHIAYYKDTSLLVQQSYKDQAESVYRQGRPFMERLSVDAAMLAPSPQSSTPVVPTKAIDNAILLVESDTPPCSVANKTAVESCIIGTGSSFYMCKGFCAGAKEVVRGGIGVRKTKKPVGLSGMATVARCSACFYEVSLQDIENDINKLGHANLSRIGVRYRLRFLQKTHVPTNRADDSLFACPFCVEAGHTLDEGDSTVFFDPDAFFRHIARHPRPLPNVNGFVVVDGPTVPDHLKNDYDIHLPQAALPHPSIKNADRSVPLPNAIAKNHVRKASGLRLPPDRTPALEMIKGGRIARITWPTKYLGQWCLGWHDGVQGMIPFDAIRLELPPVNQIRIAGTSNICAQARWAFSHKDKINKAKWLRFKKGDTITNIGWSCPEYWCWFGTNSKGEIGFFAQAFIDSDTLRELTYIGTSRASSLCSERSKSSSVLPRFTMRNRQSLPSITGLMFGN